jgi:hypothetical protein
MFPLGPESQSALYHFSLETTLHKWGAKNAQSSGCIVRQGPRGKVKYEMYALVQGSL